MLKNIKSMQYSIRLMEIGGMFPFVILINTVINFINIKIGYDMKFLDGLWIPANIVFLMILFVTVTMLAMNYVNYYKLLIAMPMKLDKTPVQMLLMMDFTFLIITIIDIILMAANGYGKVILIKIASMFIIYSAACILFYISIRTGFKFYGTIGKVLSTILCLIIYGICTAFMMAVLVLMHDYPIDLFGDNIPLFIFAACGVLAAVVRIVSYMGVKNCVRQRKIYKVKTKNSKVKSESYV